MKTCHCAFCNLKTCSHSKALQTDMSNKEPELRLLLDKGQHMIDHASPMSDVSDLSDKVDGMRSNWKSLREKMAERNSKLKEVGKHSEKFHDDLDTMLLWLQLNEEKLESAAAVGLDKDTVAKQLKDAQALQTELLRKSRDHEALNQVGQSLIDTSEKDQDMVREKLEQLNGRWESLNDGVGERVQALEDTQQKLSEFSDLEQDLASSLKKFEEKMAAHRTLGVAGKDSKYLDKMKGLQDEVRGLEPQVGYLKDFVQSLLADAAPGADPAGISDARDKIVERYDSLNRELEDWVERMECASETVGQFQVCTDHIISLVH